MAEFWDTQSNEQQEEWASKGVFPRSDDALLQEASKSGGSFTRGLPGGGSVSGSFKESEGPEEVVIKREFNRNAQQLRSDKVEAINNEQAEQIRRSIASGGAASGGPAWAGGDAKGFNDPEENNRRFQRHLQSIGNSEVKGRAMAAQMMNPESLYSTKPSFFDTEEGAIATKELVKSGMGKEGLTAYQNDLAKFKSTLNDSFGSGTSATPISPEDAKAKAIELAKGTKFSADVAADIVKTNKPEAVRLYEESAREEAEVIRQSELAGKVAHGKQQAYENAEIRGYGENPDLVKANPATLDAEQKVEQQEAKARIRKKKISEGKIPSASDSANRARSGDFFIRKDSDGWVYATGERASPSEARVVIEQASEEAAARYGLNAEDVEKVVTGPKKYAITSDAPDGEVEVESIDRDRKDKIMSDIESLLLDGAGVSDNRNVENILMSRYSEELRPSTIERYLNDASKNIWQRQSSAVLKDIDFKESQIQEEGGKALGEATKDVIDALRDDPERMLKNFINQTVPAIDIVGFSRSETDLTYVDAVDFVVNELAEKVPGNNEAAVTQVQKIRESIATGDTKRKYPQIDEAARNMLKAAVNYRAGQETVQAEVISDFVSKHTDVRGNTVPAEAVLTMLTLPDNREVGVIGRTSEEREFAKRIGAAIAANPRTFEAFEVAGISVGSFLGDETQSQKQGMAAIMAAYNTGDLSDEAIAMAGEYLPPRDMLRPSGAAYDNSPMSHIDEAVLASDAVINESSDAVDEKYIPKSQEGRALFNAGMAKKDLFMIRAAHFIDYGRQVASAKSNARVAIGLSNVIPQDSVNIEGVSKGIAEAHEAEVDPDIKTQSWESLISENKQAYNSVQETVEELERLGRYDSFEYKKGKQFMEMYDGWRSALSAERRSRVGRSYFDKFNDESQPFGDYR